MSISFMVEKILHFIGVVIILVGLLASVYFYIQSQRVKRELTEANAVVPQDIKGIFINEVGKLIQLPTDEEPTIIRINNAKRAKSQPFFLNAKDGDVVLLYKRAKRAILYDPAAKRVVQAGPLQEGSGSASLPANGDN